MTSRTRRVAPWIGAAAFVFVVFIVALAGQHSFAEPTATPGATAPAPAYTFTFPTGWKQTAAGGGATVLMANQGNVGGIELLGAPGPEPDGLTALLPNHSQVTAVSQAQVVAGKVVIFDMVRTLPAAQVQAGDMTTWSETHCLLVRNNVTYDIWSRQTPSTPAADARRGLISILQSLRWADQAAVNYGLVTMVYTTSKEALPGGAIWGDFDVTVVLRNNTPGKLTGLKLMVQQVVSNNTYPTEVPRVDVSSVPVAPLTAGQTVTLIVKGFHADHPELTQEVLVNVVGAEGAAKMPLKTAFRPGAD